MDLSDNPHENRLGLRHSLSFFCSITVHALIYEQHSRKPVICARGGVPSQVREMREVLLEIQGPRVQPKSEEMLTELGRISLSNRLASQQVTRTARSHFTELSSPFQHFFALEHVDDTTITSSPEEKKSFFFF